MAIFANENDMQIWLRNALHEDSEALAGLITNRHYVEEATAHTAQEQKILQSYSNSLESLFLLELVADNENISLKNGEILKPDFIFYSLETEVLVIMELKNAKSASRQLGTEMAAYSGELRSYLPLIAEGDIVHAIISTDWPTLLRHYIMHEILWMQKNVICLEPIETIEGIRLSIKDISIFKDDTNSSKLAEHHLGGYQICLYDDDLYLENSKRTRLDAHVEQMKTAIHALAQKGNSVKSHGFAFLWKDKWQESLAPYNITLLNCASFQGMDRFILQQEKIPELNKIQKKIIELLKEYDPLGHGKALEMIQTHGCKFLKGFCKPYPEGFTSWRPLKEIMLPRAELLSFIGWGIFGEAMNDQLAQEYQKGHLGYRFDCPELGLRVVESLINYDAPYIDWSFFDGPND